MIESFSGAIIVIEILTNIKHLFQFKGKIRKPTQLKCKTVKNEAIKNVSTSIEDALCVSAWRIIWNLGEAAFVHIRLKYFPSHFLYGNV